MDQNSACAEIGYSYQNIEYCKVLNIDNSFMSKNKNVKCVHAKSNRRWLRPRPRTNVSAYLMLRLKAVTKAALCAGRQTVTKTFARIDTKMSKRIYFRTLGLARV